jgi:demethylmenaquinone methyltransferase/2-methoxy-6-polyprenyl-1,4-benzoquinol methylase
MYPDSCDFPNRYSVMAQTIDKSGERVRKMFGEIAPNYDRLNHLLSMNVDRLWRRKVVRRLAPSPGDPILDVCCGTGDLALAFWRQTKGRCPIVGTDFCPQMLEIARVKQERAQATPEQIRFVEADSQQLPFDDNSFHFVTVAFGLRNISDPQLGLREMTRVCRPGGSVAILEFSIPRQQPIKAAYLLYFKYVLPVIGRLVNRNQTTAYDYLPASVGEFPAYEGLAAWMRDAGLRDVTFKPLTFGIATLYVGVK